MIMDSTPNLHPLFLPVVEAKEEEEVDPLDQRWSPCLSWSMGSIDEKIDLEAHEELTFSSSAATGDIEALHFETVHLHSRADGAYSWISKNVGRIRTPRSLYLVLLNANMLLPCGPLAIWLHIVTEKQLIGHGTINRAFRICDWQLTLHSEPKVGGLINVTFVTVPEIFSSLFALRKDMIRVVQRSLLGF
ncbi:hypothetical protein RchiOBHm_Chr2g0150381 [Rosa chinensis]|uniref:Uncharacterized protein n=1 Tax=Rosa chinensis TaxID=74649 RepID=A0A2P6RZV9_ROSCH|nr:hypothetical protein RchiOBHm_Chr2g0150381 [Rosa chinensis]